MNNKGFAITTLIYGLAIMMLLLIAIIMAILSSMRRNIKDLSDEIENELLVVSKGTVEYTGYSEGNEDTYTVPQGGAGYYRIEVWGPPSAGQNGYYVSGIIKLPEKQDLIIHRGKKDTADNIAYISYPYHKEKARLLYADNRAGMMIGSPDYYGRLFSITSTNNTHSFAFFRNFGVTEFFSDTLIIPNTFASDDYAKVSIRRILSSNENSDSIPYNRKSWSNSNLIRVRAIPEEKSDLLNECTIYYTYQKTYVMPSFTDCTTLNAKNDVCQRGKFEDGDFVMKTSRETDKIDSLALICPDSDVLKDIKIRIMLNSGGTPKDINATDELTNYNIIYEGKYRHNYGRGIEVSEYQLDGYVDKPDHGNFYIMAADNNKYALTVQKDGISVGMDLLGSKDTQRWSIDKVCNYNLLSHECVNDEPNGTTIDKVYRIVEQTTYNSLDIKLDENIEGNEITAQYNYNTLSINEPQLWRLIPNKDGTYSFKTVVDPQDLADTNLGYVTYDEKVLSSEPADLGGTYYPKIGRSGESEILDTQKFRLFSYDYSIK